MIASGLVLVGVLVAGAAMHHASASERADRPAALTEAAARLGDSSANAGHPVTLKKREEKKRKCVFLEIVWIL